MEADGQNDLAADIAEDWRSVGLSKKEEAMLEYSEKITLAASNMTQDDVEQLREVGWNDREILDISLIASYYNFRTRMADALGVELDEAFADGEMAREIGRRNITPVHK